MDRSRHQEVLQAHDSWDRAVQARNSLLARIDESRQKISKLENEHSEAAEKRKLALARTAATGDRRDELEAAGIRLQHLTNLVDTERDLLDAMIASRSRFESEIAQAQAAYKIARREYCNQVAQSFEQKLKTNKDLQEGLRLIAAAYIASVDSRIEHFGQLMWDGIVESIMPSLTDDDFDEARAKFRRMYLSLPG